MAANQDKHHRIPRGARGAILNYVNEHGVDPGLVLDELRLREGFGDDRDLIRHVRETYGDDEAESLQRLAAEEIKVAVADELGETGRGMSRSTTAQMRDYAADRERPKALLLHVPDPLFASAIESAWVREWEAWGKYDNVPPLGEIEDFVNKRLEAVGAPYRLDENGEVSWVGEKTLSETAIEPALAALRDERLATPAKDFDHAIRDLRKGTTRSLKDATNYATKALEGTMVAVLEAHGESLPEKTQVWKLWEALREAKSEILPEGEMMKELVVAGSRVSNVKGRHSDPRDVTPIEAEVSVVAVANAIHYLASLLPVTE